MWQPKIAVAVLTHAGLQESAPMPSSWSEAALFAKLQELGLASEASVHVMRDHLRSGRFTLQHYIDMYRGKIDQAVHRAGADRCAVFAGSATN